MDLKVQHYQICISSISNKNCQQVKNMYYTKINNHTKTSKEQDKRCLVILNSYQRHSLACQVHQLTQNYCSGYLSQLFDSSDSQLWFEKSEKKLTRKNIKLNWVLNGKFNLEKQIT